MALKGNEQGYKDLLIAKSFEWLYNRMSHPETKHEVKDKIAIAMSKAYLASNQKIEHSGSINGLAGIIKKAADEKAISNENAA